MTIFNVTITDTHQLAGIAAARVAYNASNAGVQGFVPLTQDADYVQFVMTGAAQSYASQYGT
jgi:hypothetical protein